MTLGDGLTIQDYERLPQAIARNHELVDGKLVEAPGRTLQHNLVRDYLIELLHPYVRERLLGIVVGSQGFDFDGNAYAPDLSFIKESKRPLLNKRLRVQRFVPDLAIEIVSTNDTFEKLVKKAQRYRACGTAEVWIFSVEVREVFLYSERGRAILDENEEFRPEPIPGFAIRIADLFSRC